MKQSIIDTLFGAILVLLVIAAITGVVGTVVYEIKYDKECTCVHEATTGTVIDKSKHKRLSSAKPVIYRTEYKTTVSIPDGEETTFSGAEVYNACEVGDEILIDVERKYHKEELVEVNYKTIDSQPEGTE